MSEVVIGILILPIHERLPRTFTTHKYIDIVYYLVKDRGVVYID